MPFDALPPDLVLKTIDLKKYYEVGGLLSKKRIIKAVDGVSVNIGNEVYCIVGESGCGKSTFARTLLGLEDITDGDVLLRVPKELAEELRRMGEKVREIPYPIDI